MVVEGFTVVKVVEAIVVGDVMPVVAEEADVICVDTEEEPAVADKVVSPLPAPATVVGADVSPLLAVVE